MVIGVVCRDLSFSESVVRLGHIVVVINVSDTFPRTNALGIGNKSTTSRNRVTVPDIVRGHGGDDWNSPLSLDRVHGVLDIIRKTVDENLCAAESVFDSGLWRYSHVFGPYLDVVTVAVML